MASEWTRRPLLLIAALAAVLVALWLPATGQAASRDRLASAGQLERGSGYAEEGGSDAVRSLQRRLRRLGNEPGPIDGLYGPLTQGAVERFQQRHGLAVDGIVGRQTRRTLVTVTSRPTASPAKRDTRPGTLARKSPAPGFGAESASEQSHARPEPAGVATRDGPATGTGVPPEAIAGLAVLAALTLLLTLRKQGEVRLNTGLTCAALLGVFGVGAVAGALFATRAAPRATDRATARSGLLLADVPVRAGRALTRRPRTTTVAIPERRPAARARASAPAPPTGVAGLQPIGRPAPVAQVPAAASPAPVAKLPARPAPARRHWRARRLDRTGTASDSSLGGGIRAGAPVVLDAGGGLGAP